jgi:hypothetical protein
MGKKKKKLKLTKAEKKAAQRTAGTEPSGQEAAANDPGNHSV